MDKIYYGSLKKYNLLLTIDILLIVLDIILFSFSVVSLLFFLVSLVLTVLGFALLILLILKNKKRKIIKVDPKNTNIIITDNDIISLYNKAGIPIIYDEEGKIKDIFELIGLKVEYDEFGNRITTIYERLKIVPRFDKNGKEIPTFLSIKNRVRGFIKPEKQTGTLTRILTEQEKEELLLRQMLEQKLQESEEKGDTKKAKVIKKVIEQKKKEKEDEPKKEGYVKLATAKPINMPKPKAVKSKPYGFNPIKDINELFNISLPKIKTPYFILPQSEKPDENKPVPGFTLGGKSSTEKGANKRVTPVITSVPRQSKPSFLRKLTRDSSISNKTGLDSNVYEK